jgi:hypothetical protein
MFVCLFLLHLLTAISAIKILQSKLSQSDYGLSVSGAKLVDDRKVQLQELSICMRFNFKRLSSSQGRSTLIYIHDWMESPEVGVNWLYIGHTNRRMQMSGVELWQNTGTMAIPTFQHV